MIYDLILHALFKTEHIFLVVLSDLACNKQDGFLTFLKKIRQIFTPCRSIFWTNKYKMMFILYPITATT